MTVHFVCYSQEAASMQWYKTTEGSNDFYNLDSNSSHYSIERTDTLINLTIFRITYEDNGIYVCDSKNLTVNKRLHLCGTELRVTSEWELPVPHAAQEMLFLLLSPFPPPYEPYAPTSPHAGGTPSDTAEDAPWHHGGFFAHGQPSSRTTSPGLPWHVQPRNISGTACPSQIRFFPRPCPRCLWSLMAAPGAVRNALASPKGWGMSPWTTLPVLANARTCGHAELIPVSPEPGMEVGLGALPVLLSQVTLASSRSRAGIP